MVDRRVDAEALDRADPLAAFRERFVITDDRIYLDGNSLGRLPHATAERLGAMTADWGARLVTGWDDWLDAPRRTGDVLAPVIGAQPGEVLCCDSVTVNLYKLAAAIHRQGPLVTDATDFPTDRYVLQGLATERGVPFSHDPQGAGLIVRSHVDYRTGALADMQPSDTPTIWDLSYSAGAVEIDLSDIEYAVGCTYKYLNGGPGAPAFLYVRKDRQAALRSPIWGWFAQRDQFDMDRAYDPQPGIARFLAGTPPILGLAAVEEGARITTEAGLPAIAAKARAQTQLIIDHAPCEVLTPDVRGSHVALRHPDARALTAALIERDVILDFRAPDVIRFGVAPLYTRYVDVWDAVERLTNLLAQR
ncbi:MAG: kynureninase [Solirubrobacteraceae bacterium]|nr:kynureninase [Solirubrobacteraceae bacterium]